MTCFMTNNTAKENEQYKGRTTSLVSNPVSSCLNLDEDDYDELRGEQSAGTKQDQINTCCEDQSPNLQVYKYLEGQLICQAESGCDINVQNSLGFTALHFLINGKLSKTFILYVL